MYTFDIKKIDGKFYRLSNKHFMSRLCDININRYIVPKRSGFDV